MNTITPRAEATKLLEAVDIWRRFGQTWAVQGAGLQVQKGEVFGLLGPDAAGKTTLIRILVGLLDPDRGQARLLGHPATAESAEVRASIGYMPQQYSLYGDLTVGENLAFFASMFGLRQAEYSERRKKLLQLTRLERFHDRRADALSGGMYKKLALACALLHQPQVLVLDEPTNGVDPVSRREFWDLIASFVREGMGVLISTPYMDEASRCSRVALMHQGRILEQGVPHDMLKRFEGAAFRVEGPHRDLLAQHHHPAVIALSPSGGSLRVVVSPSGLEDIRQLAARHEATLVPVPPIFEDVFLDRLRNTSVQPHEQNP